MPVCWPLISGSRRCCSCALAASPPVVCTSIHQVCVCVCVSVCECECECLCVSCGIYPRVVSSESVYRALSLSVCTYCLYFYRSLLHTPRVFICVREREREREEREGGRMRRRMMMRDKEEGRDRERTGIDPHFLFQSISVLFWFLVSCSRVPAHHTCPASPRR